jgi:hypothetical protein
VKWNECLRNKMSNIIKRYTDRTKFYCFFHILLVLLCIVVYVVVLFCMLLFQFVYYVFLLLRMFLLGIVFHCAALCIVYV